VTLDFLTIAVVAVGVAGIVGVLMLVSYAENRAMTAWAWWGSAYLLIAVGFSLVTLRAVVGNLVSIVIANAVVLLGYGMLWIGARAFEGRRSPKAFLLIAPVAWIAACQVTLFANDINARIVVATAVMCLFCSLATWELWRGRQEQLRARTGAMLLLTAYVMLLVARIVSTLLAPLAEGAPLASSGWFIQSAVGGLVLSLTLGFFLLILPRQRMEIRYKTAALVDPLTGIANRRAFLEQAAELMRARVGAGRPAAVLLFDLDRFKEINDCHGHAAGDLALQVFADAVARHLRAGDLIGRLGGEEFAAVLPGTELNAAVAIGELIRERFSQEAAEIGGQPVHATVSVGIVCTDEASVGIDELLAHADMALYRAKHAGRNRVEVLVPALRRGDLAPIDAPRLVPAMG
jgi:diguanylate cyclase (GGDEF)-like protein